MSATIVIGIDPGASGAAVVLSLSGHILDMRRWADGTPAEMLEWLAGFDYGVAYLEQVGAMPKQGVASTFKFGWNAGWWEGALAGLRIPLMATPRPGIWQRDMGCMTKGDKNVSKRLAHKLWPRQVKQLTHATADAALIAEWGRRKTVATGATKSDPAGVLEAVALDGVPTQENAL